MRGTIRLSKSVVDEAILGRSYYTLIHEISHFREDLGHAPSVGFYPNYYERVKSRAAAGYNMDGNIYSIQGSLRHYYNGEF